MSKKNTSISPYEKSLLKEYAGLKLLSRQYGGKLVKLIATEEDRPLTKEEQVEKSELEAFLKAVDDNTKAVWEKYTAYTISKHKASLEPLENETIEKKGRGK